MKVLVVLQNAWRRGAAPGDHSFAPGRTPEMARRVAAHLVAGRLRLMQTKSQ